MKELEKQVSVLNIEALKKEMSLNEQSKSEYLELNAKIQQLKIDHAQNIKEIEEEHKDALKRLEESLIRDFKVHCLDTLCYINCPVHVISQKKGCFYNNQAGFERIEARR